MESALYFGAVRHRRGRDVEHAFRFPLCMAYLDLSELDTVFDGRWLWSTRRAAWARFDPRDHLGGGVLPLTGVVRKTVEERTGRAPAGPIRLLTQLRYAGYVFNPVSFYYCFDETGESLEAVVADVTNTPWGERHSYVVSEPDEHGRGLRQNTAKSFHVSPFFDMELDYRFHFGLPGSALVARIESRDRQGCRVFDATLALRRREIRGAILARALLQYPLQTLGVHAGIYWQALRLWLARAPVHDHPRTRESETIP